MTRHVIPHKDNPLDSGQSEIRALYREGAGTAEPSSKLDSVILDAARAELKDDKSWKSGRQIPWWKRWLPATSAIAVALLGLSVSLHVMEHPDTDRTEPFSIESARPPDGKPAGNAQEPTTGLRDFSKADQNRPAVMQQHVTGSEPQTDRSARPARQEADRPGEKKAPSAMAPPSPAAEVQKETRQFEANKPQEMRDKDDAGSAASALATPSGKLEAKRRDVGSAAVTGEVPASNSAFKTADEAATPEAWLQRIRELLAARRYAEAELSLDRFRARYPDFVVPADLNHPK
ncbi:hypothetical protein [Propionivibrio sp.]|uniref:hypothetical protein n=1 Tax=Propionivibrio sp. TaxID=2212460 RepID=UPI00260EDE0A|nr:hypothetical protein [Propionivibrio sp.]